MSRIPGDSFTLSKRPAAFPDQVWEPATFGDGPYLHTASHRYLDWICALGALTVGHNHPRVVEAVERQVRQGAIFSLPSRLEAEVAERLCDIIPCAAQVKVVKTGSEATSAAIRIARAATGRQAILGLKGHYHGWHDWWASTADKHPGVDVHSVCAVASVDRLLSLLSFGPETSVAAVIVEPERVEMEKQGGLIALREATKKAGVVLIFDEMLSGGRLALAGAQEYFKVTPDLATFGKALGGGLPFAFVCGSDDVMEHAWPVSGTFSGDALGLAACKAMLDVYAEEDVIARLWQVGTSVFQALAYVGHGRPDARMLVNGYYPRFWLTFGPHIDARMVKSIFVQKCAASNVLVHQAVIFANAAMQAGHVQYSIDIMIDALDKALSGKDVLLGEPYQDSVR